MTPQMESEFEFNFKQILYDHAVNYARSKGYRFGLGANHDIEWLAGQAADKITNPVNEYAGTAAEQLLEIGKKQFELLVDNMIIARPKVYGTPSSEPEDVIGEQTLAWARARLCPMWPVC